jgi:hypothetical protein
MLPTKQPKVNIVNRSQPSMLNLPRSKLEHPQKAVLWMLETGFGLCTNDLSVQSEFKNYRLGGTTGTGVGLIPGSRVPELFGKLLINSTR